ncbi:MAG TPA: PEPxxWA-CTERM sorting domain-containing protein [Caldimonas sp.]|nr:PEPxxWA-CTERM sorting domain-containing protein [Caldimonas sp.]
MFSASSMVNRAARIALLAAAVVAGPAHAVSIDVGSYTNTGLGAEFATSYDTFTITGDKIAIAMPQAPVAISLGTFWFEVGPNCYSCALTPSFDAILDVKVQGATQQLHIPYAWHSSGPNDFLTFSQAAPLMFDFGAKGTLVIALDAITTLSSPGGKVYGDLYATASLAPAQITPVPEPASYALLLAGFGVVGFVVRRRRGVLTGAARPAL